MKWFSATVFMTFVVLAGPSGAADLQSVSRIAFGPGNILFVADWKQASVHAYEVAAPSSSGHVVADQPAVQDAQHAFNLLDIQDALESELHTREITVEDLKTRPGTDELYLAVSYGHDASPAVIVVRQDGSLRKIAVNREASEAIALRDAPTGDTVFWGRIPARSMTVSAMRWHNGKLYVAGLSNQSFSSSLRVASYPGGKAQTISSIGIFHTSHDQTETRAPIRTMTFMTIGGVDYLIAAYMCTPLVAIPVSDLRDGAHVTGKTIAELGYGNTPIDMVSFTAPNENGKPTEYLTVTNVNRNAETIPVSSIAEAVARPGLDKPVPWSVITGVDVVQSPIAGAVAIDNLDDKHFVLVRHEIRNGNLQIVSLQKAVKLRISDYISEYDFPSYAYPPGKQTTYIKPIEDGLMHEEGYSSPTAGHKTSKSN